MSTVNDSDTDSDVLEDFLEFIRIPTISANGPEDGSYRRASDFLISLLKKRLGKWLSYCEILEPVANKPIVIACLPGDQEVYNSKLEKIQKPGALLLNSHYDVVPCMMDKWNLADPFSAKIENCPKDLSGNLKQKIYGRGTQDMKCVCIQYICGLERILLKQQSEKSATGFARDVWLTFVPDEEIGGMDGMGELLKSEFFKKNVMPVAVGLDEGLANTEDAFTVRATGPTGHGSRFVKETAVEKLLSVANKAYEFRKEQENKLGYNLNGSGNGDESGSDNPHQNCGCKHSQAKKLGDVTTLNLTVLEAGVKTGPGKYAYNVIPCDAMAGFDVRISPLLKCSDFKQLLNEWTSQYEGVTWNWVPGTKASENHYVTPISSRPSYYPNENSIPSQWWEVVSNAQVFKDLGLKIEPEIFPAATDSRFVRELGVPCFGFSPMRNIEIMLHEHNEYIYVDTFLEGIEVYEKLLPELINADISDGGYICRKADQ